MQSNSFFTANSFSARLVRCSAAVLCLLLPSLPLLAEPALPADMRVVIDISGSMKQTDPANLRQPSLALLLQLLPETSLAGVWTFGESVRPLVGHGEVTADWRRSAVDLSRHIGSSDRFTRLGLALEQAAFDRHLPRERETHILLLTDGMVDIDPNPHRNEEERQRIVQQLLPQLQAAGYTVHTIALSDHADRDLLNQLAAATGGVSTVVHSADSLMKAFLRLFDQAAPAEQVPLKDNRFWVDESIEEFTALVFRRPGSAPTRLTDPAGYTYHYAAGKDSARSGANWYRTAHYDVITVSRPQPGEWQVLADLLPDSRVTIVSNLRLAVTPLPHQVYVGQKLGLSFRLEERGGTVTDVDFLNLLEIYGQLTQQQEESGEVTERWQSLLSNHYSRTSGVYQTQVEGFTADGNYRLTLVVDGKTFQRQFNHYLQAGVSPAGIAPVTSAAAQPAPAVSDAAAAEPSLAASPATGVQNPPAWILYAILATGNLVLLLIGLILYRVIMRNGPSGPDHPAAGPPARPVPAAAAILPIELNAEPGAGPTPQPLTVSSAARATDGPILNELEVDALFAELNGQWDQRPGGDKR